MSLNRSCKTFQLPDNLVAMGSDAPSIQTPSFADPSGIGLPSPWQDPRQSRAWKDNAGNFNAGDVLGALLGGVGGAAGGALGAKTGHQAYQDMTAIPKAQAAPPPPTLGSAATVSVNTELAHEQRMAAASTILTGGAGLTDEPTTASRVLLGS